MKHPKLVGIDLAKNTFQICQIDYDHQVIKNQKVSRAKFLDAIRQLPAQVIIAMEACATAHHWAREIRKLGYKVMLIPAQHVKPFVGKQKNDANDARAIAEAALRPQLNPVPIKTIAQQDIKMLISSRDRLVKARTALVNHLRGHCAEYGVVMPKGIDTFRKHVARVLEQEQNTLSAVMRVQLAVGYEELLELNKKINALEKQTQQLCAPMEDYQRLQGIPGIGPINAATAISEISDGSQFANGRNYAAFCGLVPRQHSSGDKTILSGITKNGNRRLRTLLVHSARTLVRYMATRDDGLSRWVRGIVARRGKNKAIVALANKLARICWAVLRYKTPYDAKRASA